MEEVQQSLFPWKSFWEEDDDDVEEFSEQEIKSFRTIQKYCFDFELNNLILGLSKAADDPMKRILWAAENNKLDIVRDLVTSDPSLVSTVDSDHYTPLHRASYNNHVDMAKLLLSHGANIDAQTGDGWRPLHSASRWNSVDTALLLINSGADVNAQTNGGLTAVHMAASEPENGHMLKVLLSNPSVDLSIRSKVGETAEDIGIRCSPHFELFKEASKRNVPK